MPSNGVNVQCAWWKDYYGNFVRLRGETPPKCSFATRIPHPEARANALPARMSAPDAGGSVPWARTHTHDMKFENVIVRKWCKSHFSHCEHSATTPRTARVLTVSNNVRMRKTVRPCIESVHRISSNRNGLGE